MASVAIQPALVHDVHSDYQSQPKSVSVREHVMASTVSVDEYFDELISQVHKDYADLCLSH